MAEEKKPVTKGESKKKEMTEKTTSTMTGKTVKLDKKILMIAGAVAAVLVVVMVILAFTMGEPTEKDDDEKTDNGGDSSQVDDKKDEEDKEEDKNITLDKTLATGGISMKYPSKGWKLDDSKIDGADGTASISKGNNNYVLLTTVESDAGLSTKEFADGSMSSYKTSGFMVTEALAATKIDGKEWYKARMYGQGAYATVLFYAAGNDYYIATFASTSKDESEEIKKMIETLAIK